MKTIDYASAGVDIDAGNEAVQRIKQAVEDTFSPNVLTKIGSFGAMYDLKSIIQDYHQPVLVQSIDGVGTKMMVARLMNKYDTIGADLVAATCNDIIVMGAKPHTLLDYIANDKLNPMIVEQVVVGIAKACKEFEISLIGGETAEMPGTYFPGEHDLVGVVTGVVEKDKAILGKNIVAGDVILGLSSSGLHTNGYSLARKLFFEVEQWNVHTFVPELDCLLGDALLTPHINYTQIILDLLKHDVEIKGMAHITGGGLLENIPRVLPPDCHMEITRYSWPILPIFNLLQKIGNLDESQMFRTFNMGIGYVMIVAEDKVSEVKQMTKAQVYEIGRVVS